MDEKKMLSPSVLAFMGDAVYGLLVRTKLSDISRPSGELHRLSVTLVNANAQAQAYKFIEPMLSETETDIFKRGRNFHTGTAPKSSTKAQYHAATGLEALFGYLYLSGNTQRANELFEVIWEYQNPEKNDGNS